MFAIIETGGKQLRVEEGLEYKVEKLNAEAGSELTIDNVLLVDKEGDLQIGKPYVESAKVVCEVVGHGRGEKIIVFKKRRRKDSKVKQGHRQDYTTLKVTSISL